MAITIDQRLETVEKDLNRIMESLLESVTVADTSEYAGIIGTNTKDILYRISSLEVQIQALKYQYVQAVKNKNS